MFRFESEDRSVLNESKQDLDGSNRIELINEPALRSRNRRKEHLFRLCFFGSCTLSIRNQKRFSIVGKVCVKIS